MTHPTYKQNSATPIFLPTTVCIRVETTATIWQYYCNYNCQH